MVLDLAMLVNAPRQVSRVFFFLFFYFLFFIFIFFVYGEKNSDT